MRITHKYLRNKHIHNKYWNCVRSRNQPYKTFCPYDLYGGPYCSFEEQVKRHFESITNEARALDKGHHSVFMTNASAEYRRILNGKRKAKQRHALAKIRNGNYEYEMPTFKNDAAWNYW